MKFVTRTGLAAFSMIFVFPALTFSQVRDVKPRTVKPGQSQTVDNGLQQSSDRSAGLAKTRSVSPRGSQSATPKLQSGNVGQALPVQQLPNGMRQILPGQYQQQWELGVAHVHAPIGVRVIRVQFGTPAKQQLGLEPGDYILDVNGTPVGHHQGEFYPFTDVVNYEANNPLDPNDVGWVNLSIWNMRTHQVDDPNGIWVQLRPKR